MIQVVGCFDRMLRADENFRFERQVFRDNPRAELPTKTYKTRET